MELDQRVVVRARWKAFQALLTEKREGAVPRVSYLDGVIELMSPGKTHESRAALIDRLLEVWAEENDVLIEGLGSWTLKNRAREVGAEPDECWVIGDRPHAAKPDLVLEVVHSHGGLDKLEVYHRLGIREVWFWLRERLTVHVHRGHGYVEAARSSVLRGLDVKQLAHYARHESPARAPLLYRAALRRTSREG